MKYAFMSFSTPEMSFDEMLETAKKYGYAGIEPRIDSSHGHGLEVSLTPEERKQYAKKAEAAGVRIACIATSIKCVEPLDDDSFKGFCDRIDVAKDVNAPVIRVFGGNFPDDITREDATKTCVETLNKVAEHAGNGGVTICFETHDKWCDPTHVADVLSRVDHPAVACNWDIQHPVRTGLATIEDSFNVLSPWIRHLHIHDNQGPGLNFVPMGTGDIDNKKAIELLQTIEFDGYLSGEWINWTPAEEHLPHEIGVLKGYEKELGIV